LGFQEELPPLMAAADMVVIPSLWEGLSIVLLEAMGTGCPIIATTIPSNREAVVHRESAWLVPPRDPVALAEAVIALCRDRDLARAMATAAKRRFESYYTNDRMLAQYREFYLDACKQHCGSRS